jgi:cytidylate kinase
LIIAIDGGVASGKSAVGRRVADALGLSFVDSGLMYRAITRLAAERGIDPHDSEAVTRLAQSTEIKLDGERVWADGVELTDGIYDADHAEALPLISAIPGVREALVAQQRRMGRTGVVMAGRDIGTVVFPDADHKFFLVASLDEKVRRRAAQYERRGERVDHEAMRKEVAERDRVDTERAVAPLRPAPDAVVVDTDRLDIDQVVELILQHIHTSPDSK